MELRYLFKEETKSYKIEFMEKADRIRIAAKEYFSICFALVGSSKRNMVLVREDIANSSFDFDYQLLINKIKIKYNPSPEEIKKYFLKLFWKEFESKEWTVEDSTSAITIKKKGANYSFDVVIIERNSKTLKANILKHYKENNDHIYTWEEIPEYKNHKENLKEIKGVDLWNELRDLYKDKKENDSVTKSYLLFIQSVNELVQ